MLKRGNRHPSDRRHAPKLLEQAADRSAPGPEVKVTHPSSGSGGQEAAPAPGQKSQTKKQAADKSALGSGKCVKKNPLL